MIDFNGKIVFNNYFHEYIWKNYILKEAASGGFWEDTHQPHRLWKSLKVEVDTSLNEGYTELKGWTSKPFYRPINNEFYSKYKNDLVRIASMHNALEHIDNYDFSGNLFEYIEHLIKIDDKRFVNSKCTSDEFSHIMLADNNINKYKMKDLKSDLNEIKNVQQNWNP